MPEDEEKYPSGKTTFPPSEWTIERMDRCGYLYAGTAAEVPEHGRTGRAGKS